MQDTSPRTGADCLQEERASVFQLKELFFPPPLFFFPLFSSTVNVLLSGQIHEESQNDSYHLSLYLAVQVADRSCLSWDQEGLVQRSATASYCSPSSPFIDPLDRKKKKQKQKQKRKTKPNLKMQAQQPIATRVQRKESETNPKKEKKRHLSSV